MIRIGLDMRGRSSIWSPHHGGRLIASPRAQGPHPAKDFSFIGAWATAWCWGCLRRTRDGTVPATPTPAPARPRSPPCNSTRPSRDSHQPGTTETGQGLAGIAVGCATPAHGRQRTTPGRPTTGVPRSVPGLWKAGQVTHGRGPASASCQPAVDRPWRRPGRPGPRADARRGAEGGAGGDGDAGAGAFVISDSAGGNFTQKGQCRARFVSHQDCGPTIAGYPGASRDGCASAGPPCS